VNLSKHGALIVTDRPPPYDEPTWLRMEIPVRTDWAETVTVRVANNREVGLRFPVGCPDDLLLAGTVGINIVSSLFGETKSGSFGDLES
jgi:hypothetical protein